MEKVKVYGADWCGDTRRARRHLDGLRVDYEYIDVERDPAASDWVKQQNEGKECKPTIRVGDQILSVPSDEELESALRRGGLLA